MRIDSITIQNFLGLPDFRHTLQQPFLLVAGGNGAGKSSLQDGIRFALTGALARSVKLQKDRNELITEGAASGFAEVVLDGYQIRRNIGSGATTKDEPPANPSLALCLEPARFALLPEADRRRMLFELFGVEVNRDVVREQLQLVEHITEAQIEKVLPLLRQGFPDAAKYAGEQASQARGAWKAITGENYGSQKANGWSPAAAPAGPDPAEVGRTRQALERAQERVAALTEAKGRAAGAVSQERRDELRAIADSLPAAQQQEADAEADFATAKAEVDRLTAEARGNAGTTHACPQCSTMLVIDGTNLRLAIESKTPPPRAAAQLEKAKGVLAARCKDLDNARTAVTNSVAAQQALDSLPEIDPADRTAASDLEKARADLDLHRSALRSMEADQQQADAAIGVAERAATEHAAVQGWTAVQQALSPDGIPAVLLAKALDPFNDAIAAQAARAGWGTPRISRDLALTYADRLYGLCSESERWRADVLFTIVVAVASGVKLLALDRFDVLDPAARADAVDYLVGLIADGVVDSIVATGTFKSPPRLDDVDVVWLEAGAKA